MWITYAISIRPFTTGGTDVLAKPAGARPPRRIRRQRPHRRTARGVRRPDAQVRPDRARTPTGRAHRHLAARRLRRLRRALHVLLPPRAADDADHAPRREGL